MGLDTLISETTAPIKPLRLESLEIQKKETTRGRDKVVPHIRHDSLRCRVSEMQLLIPTSCWVGRSENQNVQQDPCIFTLCSWQPATKRTTTLIEGECLADCRGSLIVFKLSTFSGNRTYRLQTDPKYGEPWEPPNARGAHSP